MYGLEKDTRSINVGPTFILDYRVVDNCKSFYDKGGLRKVHFLVKKRSNRPSLVEVVTNTL